MGYNHRVIIASYATGNPNGGGGNEDTVGGLVGTSWGTIAASYATGDPNGGEGDYDDVGGLLGSNFYGTIIASYATGNPNGGGGNEDRVGGLVGHNNEVITTSYATGDPDGGAGTGDRVGALVGRNDDRIIASYAFGNPSRGNGGVAGSHPAGLSSARGLSAMNSGTDPGTRWSTIYWNFGTNHQNPALKYNDYDGSAPGFPSCMPGNGGFPTTIPGTSTELECGITLVGGGRTGEIAVYIRSDLPLSYNLLRE